MVRILKHSISHCSDVGIVKIYPRLLTFPRHFDLRSETGISGLNAQPKINGRINRRKSNSLGCNNKLSIWYEVVYSQHISTNFVMSADVAVRI
jgi:hypothetical protein